MSNLMKRLLCVLLALMMVMALCACGESEDEGSSRGSKRGSKGETTEETTTEPTEAVPVLVGEWEAYLDMTDYLNEMMSYEMGMDDLVDDFSMRLTMEFDEDGTVVLAIDQDSLEEAAADLIDSMWTVIIEMTAEQAGMSVEEVEEMMEAEGVTKEALLEQMDLTAAFEDLDDMEGYWLLDGDELFIAEDEDDVEDADPIEIEFDGDDAFSMLGGDGLTDGLDEEMIEMFIPLEFERI